MSRATLLVSNNRRWDAPTRPAPAALHARRPPVDPRSARSGAARRVPHVGGRQHMSEANPSYQLLILPARPDARAVGPRRSVGDPPSRDPQQPQGSSQPRPPAAAGTPRANPSHTSREPRAHPPLPGANPLLYPARTQTPPQLGSRCDFDSIQVAPTAKLREEKDSLAGGAEQTGRGRPSRTSRTRPTRTIRTGPTEAERSGGAAGRQGQAAPPDRFVREASYARLASTMRAARRPSHETTRLMPM